MVMMSRNELPGRNLRLSHVQKILRRMVPRDGWYRNVSWRTNRQNVIILVRPYTSLQISINVPCRSCFTVKEKKRRQFRAIAKERPMICFCDTTSTLKRLIFLSMSLYRIRCVVYNCFDGHKFPSLKICPGSPSSNMIIISYNCRPFRYHDCDKCIHSLRWYKT